MPKSREGSSASVSDAPPAESVHVPADASCVTAASPCCATIAAAVAAWLHPSRSVKNRRAPIVRIAVVDIQTSSRTAWLGPRARGEVTCGSRGGRRFPRTGRPLWSTRSASMPLCELHAWHWRSRSLLAQPGWSRIPRRSDRASTSSLTTDESSTAPAPVVSRRCWYYRRSYFGDRRAERGDGRREDRRHGPDRGAGIHRSIGPVRVQRAGIGRAASKIRRA